MRLNIMCLFALLFTFAGQSFAANVDEWEYKTITGDLRPTPGCKKKDYAEKKASIGYRFDTQTSELCNKISYGWTKVEVLEKGEMSCEACGGKYEGKDKYRCTVKNVKVKCKIVKRGW